MAARHIRLPSIMLMCPAELQLARRGGLQVAYPAALKVPDLVCCNGLAGALDFIHVRLWDDPP
jgi:hypothetical protein